MTAARFHGPAEAGALVPATASASPFEGSADRDGTKAADLAARRPSLNLHTAANP